MIGDRMDTDIIAGVETGMETALVLSGVTTRSTMKHYSYQPHYVLNGIGDIVPKMKKKPAEKEDSSCCRFSICGEIIWQQPALFHSFADDFIRIAGMRLVTLIVIHKRVGT